MRCGAWGGGGRIHRESHRKHWRRGRDSNPRRACALNGFRDRPIQPLSHLSTARITRLSGIGARTGLHLGLHSSVSVRTDAPRHEHMPQRSDHSVAWSRSRVVEKFLQRGERSTAFQPTTSERVPQLVNMEPQCQRADMKWPLWQNDSNGASMPACRKLGLNIHAR